HTHLIRGDHMARRPTLALLAAIAAAGTSAIAVQAATAGSEHQTPPQPRHARLATVQGTSQTTTPIKHLVVIFQENVSFDHYFGPYPNATNPAGEPAFHAAPSTPKDINNYITHPDLLTNNPNGVNPQ